ncbi:MAG: DNA translocase FtsK, partial [Pseudomonadota bacterium]
GDERFWGRLVAMPPAIGALAIFAALNAPWEGWNVSAGLGGVLGDRGAAVLIASITLPPAIALNWVAGGAWLATLVLGALALGVSAGEARAAAGWMLRSLGLVAVDLWRLLTGGFGRREAVDPRPRSERLGPATPRNTARRVADPETLSHRLPRRDADSAEPDALTNPVEDGAGGAERDVDMAPETGTETLATGRAGRLLTAPLRRLVGHASERPKVDPGPRAPQTPQDARVGRTEPGADNLDTLALTSGEPTPPSDIEDRGPRRGFSLLGGFLSRRRRDETADASAPQATRNTFSGRGPEPVLNAINPRPKTAATKGQKDAALGQASGALAGALRSLRASAGEDQSAGIDRDHAYDLEGRQPVDSPRSDHGQAAPMATGQEDGEPLYDPYDPEEFDIFDQAEPSAEGTRHEPPATAGASEAGAPANPMASFARAARTQPQKAAARRPRSRRAEAEAQPSLFASAPGHEPYEAPALALLASPVTIQRPTQSQAALEENARMLETVLEDYGVRGEIVSVKPGPVVTLYELEPAPGLKASRVIGLADDIARSMSALSARIATVPGRSVIGIELPNTEREKVWLRETLESRAYGDARYPLALALGKDIEGTPVIANLAKMPHLLIAGTTGSGKSVAINTMILSLLYRLSPEQCRVIMIDPKMLELSVYDNIPHLLAPVVTDPKKAVVALKWVVAEMEERYRRMSKLGVRNIDGYNARCRDYKARGEMFTRTIQTGFEEATGEPVYETQEFEPEEMPLIVVIVDEMADLMMVAGKEIEACIQRLAQMARASGIHLIMATQRPSVDVITGTIKANFPTRISFQVTSKIDSRTILGEQGAEQLLGMGDMLYMAGGGRITRVHGPFVSDEEVEEVVRHLKSMGTPDYVMAVTEGADEETQNLVDEKLGLAAAGDGDDALYDKAVAIVARDRKCSTSYIQRKLAIGYNKAARLVEMMEDQGVVTPANAVGKREILVEER